MTRDHEDAAPVWLDWIGTPLLLLERERPVIRALNRAARALFGQDDPRAAAPSLSALLGEEPAQTLFRIWSDRPPGHPGEPCFVTCQLQGEPRTLLFRQTILPPNLAGAAAPLAGLRLFQIELPPTDSSSLALAGWQGNMLAILNWLPFGFEIMTLDQQVLFVNQSFHEMFGYPTAMIQDIEQWWLRAYPDPAERARVQVAWEERIEAARHSQTEAAPFEVVITCADGSRKPVQIRHRTIGDHCVNIYIDISAEQRLRGELQSQAMTDALTGLPNRRWFFEEATRRLAAGRGRSFAVLILDVDHFKLVNDRFGHGQGDRVLQELAERLRRTLRGDDLLARLGGEEFVALLPDAGRRETKEIAERLRQEVSRLPIATADDDSLAVLPAGGLTVSISIGATLLRADESGIDPVLLRADRMLYAAKHAGRDCVRFSTARRGRRAPAAGQPDRTDPEARPATRAPQSAPGGQGLTKSQPSRAKLIDEQPA